ncbi:hypothetical protein [Neosynechococcus sphagnicola]|uniref:hypothetical protein n=1 Tax=Neosynechococcus sphagnicola TaxID=1501145 RepID=UPI0009079B51
MNRGGWQRLSLLGKAETLLVEMGRYDPQVHPLLELVSGALAQIEEVGRQISTYGDGIETDPQRLQAVEERLIELKQVCRKYGPTLAAAIATYERLQADLAAITDGEASIGALQQIYDQRQAALIDACAQLTQYRHQAASILEARLLEELKPLAMEKVQFQVEIVPSSPTATGADRIAFLFSPNPGEPLQPLTAVASGGEMSRFLLSLKTCFSQVDGTGTLVFDEIDVGVSGRVTQAIAQKLHQLSQHHQVLCVTHQPIVAAMATHHFRVDKQFLPKSVATQGQHITEANQLATDLRTLVQVTYLDEQQRREELAQLAGGQSGQETIAFAESLLAQAATLRQHQDEALNAPPKQLRPQLTGTPKPSATARSLPNSLVWLNLAVMLSEIIISDWI